MADPWGVLVYAGSIGFILCLLPQLLKTLRTGRAEDLSWGFLALVVASSALTLPYMVHQGETVFAVSQAANLAVWGTVAVVKAASEQPWRRRHGEA
ncbi:MAG TPA: PQ-loop domain-containing transporter [Candidatus Thermoplasmatota archaeon]|nr:PQ-loop domain-containing transporter [Candidatus Thermoplasmatota archaeon]